MNFLGSKGTTWGFPGGPVVKTLCFHCRGTRSIPRWGTKIPHALWHSQKKREGDDIIHSVLQKS